MPAKDKDKRGGYNGSKRARRAELHRENQLWNARWWKAGNRGWLTGGSVASKTAKASGGK